MPTGITIVTLFPYRGSTTEEFSNTYFLTGTTPADAAAWHTLAVALATEQAKCLPGNCNTKRFYGYDSDADDRVAVWSEDLSPGGVAGSLATTTQPRAPGDCAMWVRWQTSRLTSKGKKIYLRKYLHGVVLESPTSVGDTVYSAQKTALDNFGTKMMDGTLAGGRKITGAGHTDTITATKSSTYVTTRTLKRRGKRPGS